MKKLFDSYKVVRRPIDPFITTTEYSISHER